MTAVEDVLEQIRDIAKDEHDKGDRFEQLMLHALRTDRTYVKQFPGVWRWMDWPARTGADIGVDLVAQDASGGLVAIQCKCYAPNATLTKEDIDSFVALSGQEQWTRRIIVATTDLWSPNAEKSLEGHKVPIERIGIDDLNEMTVDWSSYDVHNPTGLRASDRLALRQHQIEAIDDVRAGFQVSSRGKLIMACGTGKTFTALRIAEELAGAGKSVLFLAPSIALVDQALKEWTGECEVPIRPFAVCSDVTAGKTLEGENAGPYDLVVPPTTEPEALIAAGVHSPTDEMTVVFSTYQSIEVIAAMQASTKHVFDLIVCDEAHRTAGVASVGGDESVFAIVHDNTLVPAHKRLYMTATPRLFKPVASEAAKEADAVLASMDDPEFFGEEFHRLGFGEAVEKGLLADYRVLILTVDEKAVSESFQDLLSSNGELSLPDVARFVGCISGLAKLRGAGGAGFDGDEAPMQRAVAFWSKIVDSERFAQQFEQVADAYFDQLEAGPGGEEVSPISLPTRHVDGTTKISSRRTDIRWLKGTPPDGECRVLTNARCLTEGVDVPALDAVMFLTPRRSKIDIVQAVGRVMRKPPGKHLGYVILPIAITAGLDPAVALDKNKDYDAVWEVLQALRAHDERFNAYINRIALGSTPPGSGPDDPIKVIPVDIENAGDATADLQGRLFDYEEWTSAIYAKIVQKVGTRTYWEDWAKDVAAIAARHETRITSILDKQPAAAAAFAEFLTELHATLNDGISRDDAISMVSQHLITRPIFEALFGDDAFGAANPVSVAMTGIVAVLDEHELQTETERLEDFYASIRRRVEGIHPDDGEARQRIIKDLYGRFFKIAFPKVAESLGIVYTPIEVVDFIIRASEAALAEHFDGAGLSDAGVHILDPFTGTGTFITRLIQSGFIKDDDLPRKFTDELHANEILLLAYYIAAVNIETTYRQARARVTGDDPGYQQFPGIVLTDTFHLGETGEGTGTWDVFPVNNERAKRQRGLDIRVFLGNPPYSSGQESVNDNNANLKYSVLDASIAGTYAKRSSATNKNSLYDSYVRAIRWASDRLLPSPAGGIVAYVTNGGYIDSNTADGLRLTVADEFHHLYLYNLRGNQRTAGELSRREGGKIFDAGSRATVAIMLFVKQPGPVPAGGGTVHYRDIGEYLTREAKLTILAGELSADSGPVSLGSVAWSTITPNEHGDWINQRSTMFTELLPLDDEAGLSVFKLRTHGLKTNRDAWNYNSSGAELDANVGRMIDHFNSQVEAFAASHPVSSESIKERAQLARQTVDLDPQRFSWDGANFSDVARGRPLSAADRLTMVSTYRPFHARWVEAGSRLNSRVYRLGKVFPSAGAENLVIGVLDLGSFSPFAAFCSKTLPDDRVMGAGNATQLFPRFIYESSSGGLTQPGLFAGDAQAGRHHNVTDHALEVFRHLDHAIDRDDVFFYVYGVLHSPDYRVAFAADLKKSLPRVPQVSTAEDFWAFASAGRELAHLHTEYETIEPWPALTYDRAPAFDAKHPDAYRVLRMKHPKVASPLDPKGAKVDDRTRIIYNDWITIGSIPERVYAYELGSRSAITWVMESNRVRADKASGIVNDPNDWAAEHDDPTYILDLVGRVVTVSMRTLDIVESLPRLVL